MKIEANSAAMRYVSLFYWSALALMGGISAFTMSATFTLGIFAGGLLVIANFNILRMGVQKAFLSGDMANPKKGAGKKAALIGTFYIRLGAMGIIIFCLLATGLIDPIGMAVGLSAVVIGILAFGVFMVFKPSSREAI